MKYLFEVNCFGCKVTSFVGYETDITEMQYGTLGMELGIGRWIHCPVCDDTLNIGKEKVCGTVERIEFREALLRDWKVEASRYLDDNKKVAAIKACREITGWSLKEAKTRVEDLFAHTEMRGRQA